MDRNGGIVVNVVDIRKSLSARRAWIEITICWLPWPPNSVALRKESVDRNLQPFGVIPLDASSLSARRAWIEIRIFRLPRSATVVALRKESVDRNARSISAIPTR